MNVIDRAVGNSPPPLDDVAGCAAVDFDEKDPMIQRCGDCGNPTFVENLDGGMCLYCRCALIDEAVRSTAAALCIDPEKLLTLLGERVLLEHVGVQFRMLVEQI